MENFTKKTKQSLTARGVSNRRYIVRFRVIQLEYEYIPMKKRFFFWRFLETKPNDFGLGRTYVGHASLEEAKNQIKLAIRQITAKRYGLSEVVYEIKV